VVEHATGEAADASALAARLQREHGYLLRVVPEQSLRNWLGRLRLNTWRASLVLALHELGSLLRAGLPIDRSLNVIAGMLPNESLQGCLLRVRDEVRRGISLSDAMEGEPAYFSAFHVALVRAGEVAGAVDDALLHLADHLRNQDKLRSQVQVALIYPSILLLVGVSALVLLATVVLPQLAPIFADAGQQMPLPTRLILGLSKFLSQFGWLLAIVMIGCGLAVRQTLRQPQSRARWDQFTLKIPLVGPIILMVQTARFARTTGTSLKAGVALPVALGLARLTLTNMAINDALRAAIAEVKAGRTLTDALHRSKFFPKLSLQLISVGEESGKLDEMLVHQAELFERSSARRVEGLVAILVPAMTILIGSTVAGVLASILLAIMRLNELAT
jgi:general secretion pathway protein F